MAKASQDIFGTFSTPTYISINDAYVKKKPADKMRGKPQMMTNATKKKAATVDGYFSKKFDRPFEKEPTHDPVKTRRKEALNRRKKMLSGDYKPASPVKKLGSSGSYQGTFAGQLKYFSPEAARVKRKEKEKLNFMTNPAKKGTGYGFPNVTIGKQPEYKTSPFEAQRIKARKDAAAHRKAVRGGAWKANAPDAPQGERGFFEKNPFRPAKSQGKPKATLKPKKIAVPFYPNKPLGTMQSGGNNHSTFTPFTYVGEKAKARSAKPKTSGPIFKPVSNVKSAPSASIVNVNVARSVNAGNAASVSVL